MVAVVRAGAARGFRELVRTLGGDPEALLRRHGLDPHLFDDDDALVPAPALAGLLETAAKTLNCPDFGLRLAHAQPLEILGPLAVAIRHSATTAEAMRWGSRYLFVHTAIKLAVVHSVADNPKLAEIRYEFGPVPPGSIRQAVDLTLGFTHNVMAPLSDQGYKLIEVRLPYSAPAEASVYRRYFGAPARFEQAQAALLVPRDCMDAPLPTANRALHELAANYLEMNFPKPGTTVSARARLAISSSPAPLAAGKEQVARLLAMHPRTLQRQLAAEGLTFDAIRDRICRQTTLRYLTSTRLPLSQVSHRVGFSEQSALTRACKRWFGKAPSTIRREAASAPTA